MTVAFSRLLYSSDTTIVMLLRSAASSVWSARLTQAVQPSFVKLAVKLERTS